MYLPHCYLPRDTSVVPSPITPKRSDFGLPEEGFVFCSFNHDYKINPPMFKIWMDLLKEVTGSVLWLMKLNETAKENIAKAAIKQGVDPLRLVYATRVPTLEDHLARYRLAGLFLDTFPYNGHTTAGDALSAGLPVITLCGNSFASSVAGSLLYDIGVNELVSDSLQLYHDKAFAFATNQDERVSIENALRHKLTEKKWPPSSLAQADALQTILKAL
jgi:predicted O-linked N-acetylglucosamine transferase (SPINDLY family)